MCSSAENWKSCCATCNKTIEAARRKAARVTAPSSTTTVAPPDDDECVDVPVEKRNCARAIARNGRSICYHIDSECCKTCAPLKKDDLPDDCAYGDRSSVCHTHLCKFQQNWKVCCALCRREIAAAREGMHQLPSSDDEEIVSTCNDGRVSGMVCSQAIAKYGQKLCYQFEDVCCESCEALKKDDQPECEFGDWASGCRENFCQKKQYWQACCDTCREHIADSKSAMTTSGSCIDTSELIDGYTCPQLVSKFGKRICYHVDADCCASCAPVKDSSNKDCTYGDRSDICRQGACSTLENLYDCCETCAKEITEDADSKCMDTPVGGTTCERVVREKGTRMCYHLEETCCKTCSARKDSNAPGCEFGDRASGCRLSHCPSESNRQHCCETCSKWTEDVSSAECRDQSTGHCQQNIAKRGKSACYQIEEQCCGSCKAVKMASPDCAYGDKQLWCSGIDRQKCYNFHDTCCDSCKKLASNTTECEYGDRMPRFCQTLLPWECYDYPVACCDTCKHVRNPDAAAQCEFGDKVEAKVCLRHKADGCQSDEAQQKCCRTCASQNMDK